MHKESIYLQRWYAEEYDKDRFGGEFGRFLQTQEVETFISLLDGSSGDVLDVGAGTGKLSIPLLFQGRRVTSVDLSSEMLRIAREKAEKEGKILNSVISDAQLLCFRDNAFECVISSRMLMHLKDWKKGIAEICRVAEGVVLIDFPSLTSFAGVDFLIKRVKSFFSSATKSYKAFHTGNVVHELERNNFLVIEIKKHFFLPVKFHRWINHPNVSLSIEKLCRWLGLVKFLGSPVTVKAIKQRPYSCARVKK